MHVRTAICLHRFVVVRSILFCTENTTSKAPTYTQHTIQHLHGFGWLHLLLSWTCYLFLFSFSVCIVLFVLYAIRIVEVQGLFFDTAASDNH
jgi:hypothetical protein